MPTVYLEATNGLRLPLLFVEELEPSDVELLAATIGALAGEAPAVSVSVADQEMGASGRTVFESPELQAVHEVVEWAVTDAGIPTRDHEEFIQEAYGAQVEPGRGVLFTTLTVEAGELTGRFQLALPDALAELTLVDPDTEEAVSVDDIVDAAEAADKIRAGNRAAVTAADGVLVVEALADDLEPCDLTLLTMIKTGLFGPVARNELAREDMPQIPGGRLDAFREFLAERGVLALETSLDPSALTATQNQLDGRKTGKFLRSIRTGAMNDVPLWVSSDGHLLDGHHRWAAEAILSLGEAASFVDVIAVNLPIARLLDLAWAFNESEGIESKQHGFRFRPSQPRAPAGQSDGGRWISHGNPRTIPSVYDGHSPNLKAHAAAKKERQNKAPPIGPWRADLDTAAAKLFGKGTATALFGEHGQLAVIPFRSASRRKGEQLYNRDAVEEVLTQKTMLQRIDPRTLHATQPQVTRDGVEYYLSEEFTKSGLTYADRNKPGNRHPVVYRHPRSGQYLILSGHHRAVAKLLQGRPLEAIVIENDKSPLVASAATVDAMYRDVTSLLAIDEEFATPAAPELAISMILNGDSVIVGSAVDAEQVLIGLGVTPEQADRQVRWSAGSGIEGVSSIESER